MRPMDYLNALWAWMSRPDVVLAVSITSIVLSLVTLAINLATGRRPK